MDKYDLECMVMGSSVPYQLFEHPLVKEAGFDYNNNTGVGCFSSLHVKQMTEDGLTQLYLTIKGYHINATRTKIT